MPPVEIRGLIALSLPVSLIQRLEAAVPASERVRSAFVRKAIEPALDEHEQQATQDRERAAAARLSPAGRPSWMTAPSGLGGAARVPNRDSPPKSSRR
jgi:hypothetical protein